jgi:hypothetical protein
MEELKALVSKLAKEKFNLNLNSNELFEVTKSSLSVEEVLYRAHIFCEARINSLSNSYSADNSVNANSFVNTVFYFFSDPKNLAGMVMVLGAGFLVFRSLGFEFSIQRSFNATTEGLRLARADMSESASTVSSLHSSLQTMHDRLMAGNDLRRDQIAAIITRLGDSEILITGLRAADASIIGMVKDDRKIIAFILKVLLDHNLFTNERARQIALAYVDSYLTSSNE